MQRWILFVLFCILAACQSAPAPETHAVGENAKSAEIPSARPSDESTPELLRLAQEQGAAYGKALDYMGHQQALATGESRAGDYIVNYAIENAEGFYEVHGNSAVYHRVDRSGEVNAHVEVVVRDGRDGRFVPQLDVTATLIDDHGKTLGKKKEPFMWHPWLYHYGENWRVPKDGLYTLLIDIAPPAFRRHDQVNGARYLKAVHVRFENVRVQRGEK